MRRAKTLCLDAIKPFETETLQLLKHMIDRKQEPQEQSFYSKLMGMGAYFQQEMTVFH